MAIVTLKSLLKDAEEKNIGYGAFSIGNMEMIKGTIKAAEELNIPIILQIAEIRLKYSPLELIAPMMVQAAKEANVDVVVHLDHGLNIKTIERALEFGFTSVMFDGSNLDFNENISKVKEVVEKAKKYGASVEAELGVVGGSEDGSCDHKMVYTNPKDAKIFCEATNIDALAVAIGNSHGNYFKSPKLNFEVLKEINNIVDVPLVLHGGSGISDIDFKKCISYGIRKLNIATSSFDSLTKEVKNYIFNNKNHNYFDINIAMELGTYNNVKNHIKIFSLNY